MAAKILSLIITLVFNLAIGFFLFAGMIVTMNGYRGDDAEVGMIVYILLASGSAILTAVLSFVCCNYLQKKWESSVLSALISISVFIFLNGIISFAGVILAIIVTDFKRRGRL